MSYAIEVEKLGKRYRLGQGAGADRTLRDMLSDQLARLVPGRRTPVVAGAPPKEIWALRDVNFRVQAGEVLGIIGPNGSGKSTLLKVLSRITTPTEGRALMRGRVASLLEVGTGFHPELTGRENVYLNGAVLGMSRREIRAKFDEIVAFSGVEDFLDTPVKRYSSGMRVRLAFAVAAHLDPDILIVDEVLAVGDTAFQEKCLGKMRQLSRGGGRTVLFVSHNMAVVRSLCSRTVLLVDGQVRQVGTSDEVVAGYYDVVNGAAATGSERAWPNGDGPGGEGVRLRDVRLAREDGRLCGQFTPQEPINLSLGYDVLEPLPDVRWVLEVRTSLGELAFTSTDHAERSGDQRRPGRYESHCRIPGGLLNTGEYIVALAAGMPGRKRLIETTDLLRLRVEGVGNHGSRLGEANWPGVLCPKLDWTVRQVSADSAASAA